MKSGPYTWPQARAHLRGDYQLTAVEVTDLESRLVRDGYMAGCRREGEATVWVTVLTAAARSGDPHRYMIEKERS